MRIFARQKLRYDLGAGFMSIATFSMALIGASDKVGGTLGVSPKIVVVVGVPVVLGIVWLLGYMLDTRGFTRAYQAEMNDRNDMLQKAAGRL